MNSKENVNNGNFIYNFVTKHKIYTVTICIQILLLLCIILYMLKPLYRNNVIIQQTELPEWSSLHAYADNSNDALTFLIPDDTEESFEEDIIADTKVIFPKYGGAFYVDVQYQYLNVNAPDVLDFRYYLEFSSEGNEDKLLQNKVCLYANQKNTSAVIWLAPFVEPYDTHLYYYATQPGEIIISLVEIRESTSFRWFILISYLTICIIFWCIIFYNYKYAKLEDRLVFLGLVAIIGISSFPLFCRGIYDTKDLLFHLKRIGALGESIRYGDFQGWYSPDVANGYGYVEQIFYPRQLLYPAVLLYLLDVPLYICYKIYIVLINVFTTIAAYWSFHRMFKSKTLGVLGTGLYTLAVYRFLNLYGMNAVGELLAKIFLPLFCYAIWKLANPEIRHERLKDNIVLIFSSIGIIFSHVLTCEMILLYMPIFILINWTIYIKRDVIIGVCKSALVIFLCTISFTWPFINGLQTLSMGINQFDKHENIARYALSVSQLFRTVIPEMESAKTAGIVTLIGFILFFVLIICGKEWKLKGNLTFHIIVSLGIISGFALFLCTDLFPWGYIPYLNDILSTAFSVYQFPWRHLTFVCLLIPIIICFCIKTIVKHNLQKNSKQSTLFLSMVLLAIAAWNGFEFSDNYLQSTESCNIAYLNNEVNYALALRDYIPRELHGGDFATNEYHFSSSDIYVTDYYKSGAARYYRIVNNDAEEGYIEIPVFAYEMMKVDDTDIDQTILWSKGEKARIQIPINGYSSCNIKVYFDVPMSWYVAEVISIVSILTMFIYSIRLKMKSNV